MTLQKHECALEELKGKTEIKKRGWIQHKTGKYGPRQYTSCFMTATTAKFENEFEARPSCHMIYDAKFHHKLHEY